MSRSAAVSVDLARPRSGGPDLLMERSGLGSDPFEVRNPLATSSRVNPSRWAALMMREAATVDSEFRLWPPGLRIGCSIKAATLVIPQRLLIHPGSGRDLTRAQSVGHAPSIRVASARRTRAASTSALAGGTRTSMTTIAAPEVCTSNVKKEQHELSRAVRSRAHAARLAASTRASSSRACVSLTYTARVTQCAKSASNSATPQRLIGRGKRARGGRDPVDIGHDCDRKPVRRYGMQVFARTRTSSRALRAPLNRSARDARRGGSRT